ncbi:hypothetical protein GCM10028797_23990 [Dyella agri]
MIDEDLDWASAGHDVGRAWEWPEKPYVDKAYDRARSDAIDQPKASTCIFRRMTKEQWLPAQRPLQVPGLPTGTTFIS